MNKIFLAACASLALAANACAQVSASGAWVRATVPAQRATGAFMQLTSRADARLVGVSTPLAGAAELHRMSMVNGAMNMHPVDAIDLPAGRTVELASGGYHVMLLELKRQLKPGEAVPLTLTLESAQHKRSTLTVQATVQPLTYSPK